jgi:simple sugar transport system permease protein
VSRATRRIAEWLDRFSTATTTVLAFFSALVVGAILIVVTDDTTLAAWGRLFSRPGRAFALSWDVVWGAYSALFTGALGSPAAYGHAFSTGSSSAFITAFNPLSETLVSAAPLLLAGLAVALAFKAGMFNIGAQGQVIGGAVGAAWVAFSFKGLPVEIHMPLAVLGGFVGGAVVGFVPGFLKARTGAHEVIVTIMLNYVVLNLLLWLLSTSEFMAPGQSNAIGKNPDSSAMLPHLAGSTLRINAGIVIALAAAGGVAVLLTRTTLGFRFRMVGASAVAARAAGVSIPRMVTSVFVLAGGLAGLAGAIQVLGVDPQLAPGYSENLGFTAIVVAILGRANPGGVVLAAFLYGALEAGGLNMQAATSVPLDLVEVIQAVVVFFIAAPQLIRDIYRIRSTGKGFQLASEGWSS